MSDPPASLFLTRLNEPPSSLDDRHAREFISLVSGELERGYGFVLLLGAGMSASAGIPLITHLSQYLNRCVALALGVDVIDRDQTVNMGRRWHPRTDSWPPLSDPQRPLGTDWFLRIYEEWQLRNKGGNRDWELNLFQEALGSVAEWRSALLFLARLEVDYVGPDKGETLRLSAPSQEVIDSLFLHVTSGRMPTLPHRMVAHLASALRVRAMLSTNFDELIEGAFADIHRPLSVFDLQIGSALPPLSDLRSTHSLIKMHGGRYSLRGDYTLDRKPDDVEIEHFLSYLTDRIPEPEGGTRFGGVKNQLLIMGFSASDRRIRQLIQKALIELPRPFTVFWICYTRGDLDAVAGLASDVESVVKHGARIVVLRHTDLGLLLLHLYQTLTHTLPPSGVVFPSTSRLAIPPQPVSVGSRPHAGFLTELNKAVELLRNRVRAVQDRHYSGRRLIVASTDYEQSEGGVLREVRGLTTAAALLFEELQEQGQMCLWLDLNDISSTDDLFEQLLDAMWYACGIDEWMPVYVREDSRRRAEEVRRITLATGRKWVVFLNGREKAGSNFSDYGSDLPNGWLDLPRKDDRERVAGADIPDRSACTTAVLDFLLELCGPVCPSVTVILLCRLGTSSSPSPLRNLLRDYGEAHTSGFNVDTWIELRRSCVPFDEDSRVRNVLKWAAGKESRLQFVHALVLMQRTRFIATFWSAAFTDTRSSLKGSCVNKWLVALERRRAFRRKTGGFVWMHTPIRNKLRLLLNTSPDEINCNTFQLPNDVCELAKTLDRYKNTAYIHRRLADWYRGVFNASLQPGAIFEALYHACEAGRLFASAVHGRDYIHAERVLCWAYELLNDNTHIIQRTGFSRGSCRKLSTVLAQVRQIKEAMAATDTETAAGRALETVLLGMQKLCFTVMRGIAKEVAEHLTAIKRHRQLLRATVTREVRSEEYQSEAERIDYNVPFFADRDVPAIQALQEFAKGRECGSKGDERPSRAGRQQVWMEWLSWLGTLSMNVRSFCSAEKCLRRVLVVAIGDDTVSFPSITRIVEGDGHTQSEVIKKRTAAVKRICAALKRLSARISRRDALCLGVAVGDMREVRLATVRALEQYAQLMLLLDSVFQRNESANFGTLLGVAKVAVTEGLRILDLADVQLSRETTAQPLFRARLRSRLLSHLSIVEILRGDSVRAHKCLSEAEAELSRHDSIHLGGSWARLSLHAAEVAIQSAYAECENGDRNGGTQFRRYCEELRHAALEDKVRKEMIKPVEVWRGVLAKLRDASVALGQAERALATRRKNVWWTTWLFQRRLELIEMELWLKSGEIGQPIPFLGLEFAPRWTSTLADEMLENSQRMVRVDSYRLATAVQAYAYSVLALRVRLRFDDTVERMGERQEEMRQRLATSLKQLREIHAFRLKECPETLPLSRTVIRFVEKVFKTADTVLERVEEILY